MTKINLYLFLSILFILFTNEYYSLQEALDLKFSDSNDYIIAGSNLLDNNLQVQFNLRVFFPYIIFKISTLIGLEFHNTISIFSKIILSLIFFLQMLIFNKLKLTSNLKTYLLLIIIFNPYFLRFYIAVPFYINDQIFILSTQLFILNILNKNKILTAFFIFTSFAREQSLILIYYLFRAKNISIPKKFIEKICIFIFFFIFIFTIMIANYNFFDVSNASYKNKLIYFFYPLLSFWFILILLIFMRNLIIKNLSLTNIKIFSCFLIIFIIPYLLGLDIVGKNIVRLTSLSFLLLINFVGHILSVNRINLLSNHYLLSNFKFKVCLIILIVWSMHPTFSKIKFFEFLKISL